MSTASLAGSTSIVTGASRGFGRAVAVALAANAADVVGVARDHAALQDLQRQLGSSFTPVVADVADDTVASRLIAECQPRHPGAQRRRDPAPGDDSGPDLGNLQRELARRRSPCVRVRPCSAACSARARFVGDQPVERRGQDGFAHERRIRRRQGNDRVHQFLRPLRVRTSLVGHSIRGPAAEADAGNRIGLDIRRRLRGLRRSIAETPISNSWARVLTAEQVAAAIVHVAITAPTGPRLPAHRRRADGSRMSRAPADRLARQ